MDAPFRLTFGVELEFIARYKREDYKERLLAAEEELWPTGPNPPLHVQYGITVRLHMIQILNENGFPTNSYRYKDLSKWTVDTDGTLASDDRNEDWYAIELKTPVLISCQANLDKIQTVVELLVSKFKLYTNESCGLHVHVGNENRGFTLPTLKSFCFLITAFENQLNSLHPPHRLDNENAKNTCQIFRPGASRAEKLSIVAKLRSVDDLISEFQGDHDKATAFNFCNLQECLHDPFRTIEFRQHRGTLDPELIVNWVTLACHLVNVSHHARDGFRDLITKHFYDTRYTVIDLFQDLNLPIQAKFYAPLVFAQREKNQNPAGADELMSNDTPWEKKFAPRPPVPYKLGAYSHTQSTCRDSLSAQESSHEAYMKGQPAEDMEDRPRENP